MSRFFTHHRDAGYDANSIRVPLTDDYVHDLDATLAAITPNTTVISINNPE
jgi:histidinol-phosphate/aromatic aminotransferase/cobyric acid decarboxylase-like protein